MRAYTERYRSTDVGTVNRVRLVIMMYEGAIAAIRAARKHLDGGNLSRKGTYINRAGSIVAELQSVLDMDKGGEISRNLDRLYAYVIEQLTEANIENNPAKLAVAERVLSILKEGWDGIAHMPEVQGVVAPAMAARPSAPAQLVAGR